MRRLAWGVLFTAAGIVVAYVAILPGLGVSVLPPLDATMTGDSERGSYVATAAGCYACHTDTKNKGQAYAGGRAFKTPFGTIFSPNITSDRKTGIGGWSVADFRHALRVGMRPDGSHYFPAFPYTSYAHMSDQDVVDLKAYFDTVPAISNLNRLHDMSWPFSDRALVGAWKWLYAPRRPRTAITENATALARGAYLVEVLGHCGECHTQRNALGGYVGAPLAGSNTGPNGGKVPSLRGLAGEWSADDLVAYLSDGMTPSGDFVGGEMAQVIDHSTGKLTDEDRHAIAAYLLDNAK